MRVPALLLMALCLAGCTGMSAREGSGGVSVPDSIAGSQGFALRLVSFRERRFVSTIRQRYDFSCGSAAIATLLTHHYARPTTEEQVFRAMFEGGDGARIRAEGFSMLDMQRYLASRGLQANGYRLPLSRIEELRIPAIVLIDIAGYRHFVVLRGIRPDRVLLGDPNLGTRSMPRAEFERAWNGVLFFILDHMEIAQASFSRAEDWNARPRAAPELARGMIDLGSIGIGIRDNRLF